MLRGEHQLQFDPGQLDEGNFLLRWLDREAAIEVRDEDLLEIAIGRREIADPINSEFLRQTSLDSAERALAAAPGLRRTGQDLADAECTERLAYLTILFLGRSLSDLFGTAEVAAAVGVKFA